MIIPLHVSVSCHWLPTPALFDDNANIFDEKMRSTDAKWCFEVRCTEVNKTVIVLHRQAEMLSRQSLNILSSILIFFPTGQNKSMDLFRAHVQNQSHSFYTGSLEGGRIGQQTCLQLPLPEAHAP